MRKLPVSILMGMLLLMNPIATFAVDNQAFRNVEVANPIIQFVIRGEARAWEAVFHYRVKAGNNVIAEGFQTASTGAPDWGSFSFDMAFEKSQVKGKNLQLELFEKSQQDGSEVNKLTIPLQNIENQAYQNHTFRQVTGQAKYIYEVQGEARVFEGTYHFEVSDGHDILIQGFGTSSHGAPKWGTLRETIEIPRTDVPINGTILLELYEPNMSDEGPPRLHSYFHALDQFPW